MNLRDAESRFFVDALFYWLFKHGMLFVIRADEKGGFPFHRRRWVFCCVSAWQYYSTNGDLGRALPLLMELLCRPPLGTQF